jgi:hypothetical protein
MFVTCKEFINNTDFIIYKISRHIFRHYRKLENILLLVPKPCLLVRVGANAKEVN